MVFFSAPLNVLLLAVHGHYFNEGNVRGMLCFETPCHMCTHIAQCKRQKHDWWDVLLAKSGGVGGGYKTRVSYVNEMIHQI